MTERELTKLQKEYRRFFLEKLHSYGVNSPAQLTKEEKSELFNAIKADWPKIKQAKLTLVTTSSVDNTSIQQPIKENIPNTVEQIKNSKSDLVPRGFSKQIIKSLPNAEQRDDSKILYTPNDSFCQGRNYCYPVVKMPNKNSSLKLPRSGRSNQKGYKEREFFYQLKHHFTGLELTDNVHMVIPNFNKPYEPDIVMYDKSINLYIDIEIDEPYDGYYRYPTHHIKLEEDYKQDDIRDLFFTESGWIVIRFTEKQVHLQSDECIEHIHNVIKSIYQQGFNNKPTCELENQWDVNQSIQWQKCNYRERYLGIDQFHKRYATIEIEVNIDEAEPIESVIQRTKLFDFENSNPLIAFDEEAHKYIHPNDQTGNASYISVTTLIERFFPFDLKRYTEKKANEEMCPEEDVLIEFLMKRDEAADKGTLLHKQIENYLKGDAFVSDFTEMDYFLNFFNNQIKSRNLTFHDAEIRIVSHRYNVAGTVDCIFKKIEKDEYVMLDWKRSTKLIIDGRPRMYGYGYALSDLSYLDNSSYYKYCLQQNIYKHILEKEYALKISSMKLVVLHEKYSKYHVVPVPDLTKEALIILNSIQHKI